MDNKHKHEWNHFILHVKNIFSLKLTLDIDKFVANRKS